MKKLFLLLTICMVYTALFSQTSLSGKVTEESGEPVILGNVILFKDGAMITGTETDFDGNYHIVNIDAGTYDVEASYVGAQTQRITGVVIFAGKANSLNITMSSGISLDEVVVTGYKVPLIEQDNTTQGSTITFGGRDGRRPANVPGNFQTNNRQSVRKNSNKTQQSNLRGSRSNSAKYYVDGQEISSKKQQRKIQREQRKNNANTEDYNKLTENAFKSPVQDPLSTFSIDVDNAAYSNVRRFINGNQKPPAYAVRTEEMLNYFNYDYPQPKDDAPFSINTELANCPWNIDHYLIHLGLQGKSIDLEKAPPSNLVFLLDVSGSMNSPNKLPLVKAAFKLLVNNLRPKDKIAIVVYAGAAGLVLPATPGHEKEQILAAIDRLNAGGSTAGGAGINLAYNIAKENFLADGNNRVILATDGDFNVGISSNGGLEELIEKKRKEDIFLTVLGFGMGNYKDNKLETLADKGNGNYAYIDNVREAKKVFVTELGSTLFTIAKDVKIQIEFNPQYVESYRLIGYENRLLNKEDFNDDSKDAGELGAGHTVTALYEIIPQGIQKSDIQSAPVDPLKYQKTSINNTFSQSNELLTVKLRYKNPREKESLLLTQAQDNQVMEWGQSSNNFRFSAAVAGFSLLLRNSKFAGDLTYQKVLNLAKESIGTDEYGYRKEFLGLVESTELLEVAAQK